MYTKTINSRNMSINNLRHLKRKRVIRFKPHILLNMRRSTINNPPLRGKCLHLQLMVLHFWINTKRRPSYNNQFTRPPLQQPHPNMTSMINTTNTMYLARPRSQLRSQQQAPTQSNRFRALQVRKYQILLNM